MELTRAERQIYYASDSGNKNWSTFFKKPGWDGIRIRLFVRKVKKNIWDFEFSGRPESGENGRCCRRSRWVRGHSGRESTKRQTKFWYFVSEEGSKASLALWWQTNPKGAWSGSRDPLFQFRHLQSYLRNDWNGSRHILYIHADRIYQVLGFLWQATL